MRGHRFDPRSGSMLFHTAKKKKKLSKIQVSRGKTGVGTGSIWSQKREKPRDYGDSVDFPRENKWGEIDGQKRTRMEVGEDYSNPGFCLPVTETLLKWL